MVDSFLSSRLLLFVPIILSIFTHLWNPLGIAALVYDEGTYIGRAMHTLQGNGPQTEPYYDHPYFASLLLAGIFKILDYPNLFHPSANGDIHSIEMLWLAPRIIMALLAVVDTFLIYEIAELRYNSRKVGFIASILFSVTPSTSFLSKVYLDSLLLPFLLLSILLAVFLARYSAYNPNNKLIVKKKKATIVALSGICLGLAIFTKIPAFTMIPLIGYLIYVNTAKRRISFLILWVIPVILIPAIWPAYALYYGQFGDWLDAISTQTHRQGEEGLTLTNILTNNVFKIDPILLILGIAGLVFAALRKDYFVILWVAPFVLFVYLLGFVRDFHLLLLMPIACIAASRLITELSDKITYRKIQRILPYAVISTIAAVGLMTLVNMMVTDVNKDKFEASALLSQYLAQYTSDVPKFASYNSTSDNKITVISQHVYSWIPKYVFHLEQYDYKTPDLEPNQIPSKNDKVLLVVDSSFRNVLSLNDDVGKRLESVYSSHSSNRKGDSNDAITSTKIDIGKTIDLIFPTPLNAILEQKDQDQTVNLLNPTYIWKPTNYANVISNFTDNTTSRMDDNNYNKNKILNMVVKANNVGKVNNSAILNTEINLTKRPLLLSLEYASKSLKGKGKFFIEINNNENKDKTKNNMLWTTRLANTHGRLETKIYALPDNITNKQIQFTLYIFTDGPGRHFLNLTNAVIS